MIDLWQKLYEKEFVNVLSRVRLGYITSEDVALLEKRKISLHSDTLSGRMKEVLNTLPNDTVCLLPTRHMCAELNKEVLQSLPGNEIWLLAIDTVDCPTYLRQKVSKKA